jgi:uncharacterized membrane protein YbhN (UPF0104 family)
LVLAVVVAFGGHVLLALRLSRLVRGFGLKLGVRELLQVNLAAAFYALFLPAGNITGLLARFARFARVSRREKNYAGVALALVLDRVVATVTLCVVGLAAWLLDWPPQHRIVPVMFAGSLALMVAGYGFLVKASTWRASRAATPRRWPKKLQTLRVALQQARDLPRQVVLSALGIGIGLHLLGTAAYGLVAMSLGLQLSLMTVAWTRAAAMLVAILPISVSGLGVREGVMLVLLAPYGVSSAEALAFSLLAFASTTLAPGLIGGLIEAKALLGPLVFRRPGRA